MNDTVELILAAFSCGLFGAVLATIAAAPVALLVLIVDKLLGSRLAANVRCWLWLLVAVRLMMPFAPACPISIQQAWKLIPSQAEQAPPQAITPAAPSSAGAGDNWSTALTEGDAAATTSVTTAASHWEWEELFVYGIGLVWLFGAITILARAGTASLRFADRLRKIPFDHSPATLATLSRVCEQLGVRSVPQVKHVSNFESPALFGVFWPTICLPESSRDNLSQTELRMIFLHEVMHIRRRDGLLSWLLTLVRAAHWFNPLAWFTLRQIETHREHACDQAVRRFIDPPQRSVYADLLLRFASAQPSANLGLLGLWFARPAQKLTARIKAFTSVKDQPRKMPGWAVALALLLLACVGLTDATRTKAAAVQKREQAPSLRNLSPRSLKDYQVFSPQTVDLLNARFQESNTGSQVVELEREYDLADALRKLDEVHPHLEQPLRWLTAHFLFAEIAKKPTTKPIEDTTRVKVTTTRQGHQYVSRLLKEVSQHGHTWQVHITTRVFRTETLESVSGIDWKRGVQFAVPHPAPVEPLAATVQSEEEVAMTSSIKTLSVDYQPYLALVLRPDQLARVHKKRPAHRAAPNLTLFSGQRATIMDISSSPFIVGVNYIETPIASAAQPTVAVLNEGSQIEFLTCVNDHQTLDMRCRLTLAHIEKVDQVTLPGEKVTIQTPRASQRTISTRCRMKRGDTLILGSMADKQAGAQRPGFVYAMTAEWSADPAESQD